MKVPTYDTQVRPGQASSLTTEISAPRQPDGVAGSGGDTVMHVARELQQKYVQKEDQDARLWAINQMSQLRQQALQQYQDAADNMPEGGQDFAKGVNEKYNDLAKSFSESAPNQKARIYFDEGAAGYASQIFAHALTAEATERARYRLNSTNDSIVRNGETIRLDPTQLGPIAKEQMVAIDQLPPALKDRAKDAASKEFTYAYVGRMINDDPRSALKAIDDGTYTKTLNGLGLRVDADWMRQLRNSAETRSNGHDQMLANQLQELVKSDVQSITNTGQSINHPDLNQNNFTLAFGKDMGPVKWKEYQENKQVATKVYTALDATQLKPADEVTKYLEKVAPKPGSANYARDFEVYKVVAQEVMRRQKLLQDDPRAAVDEVLNKADVSVGFDQFGKPKDGGAPRTDDYARTAMNLALQDIAGVPKERQRVLTNLQAKSLVNELNQLPPDQVQERLNGLEQQWKAYYPLLYKQLQEHKLNGGYALIPWSANTSAGNTIVEALRTDMDSAKKSSGLQEPDIRSVQMAVERALDPFVNVVSTAGVSAERSRYIASLQNTVMKAVLLKTGTTGRTQGAAAAAVKDITDSLINSRYDIRGTYYVPRTIGESLGTPGSGQAIDVDLTRKNLDSLRDEKHLKSFNPKGFGSSNFYLTQGALNEATLDVAANRGYWVNNEMGDGVYLAVDSAGYKGLPIRNEKGERYEFKFTDLQDPIYSKPNQVVKGKIKP